MYKIWCQVNGRGRRGGRLSLSRGKGKRLLTLIGGLWCLRDIHSQLSTEGVHPHHPCMDRSISKGWELVVVARDTVESLCNVGSSLQDNLLKSQRHTSLLATLIHTPNSPIFLCFLPARSCAQDHQWLTIFTFCMPADAPVRSSFIILTTSQLGKLRLWKAESSLNTIHIFTDRAEMQNAICLALKPVVISVGQ